MKKSWAYADQPIQVPVNSGMRVSCTIFGAIGLCLKAPCIAIEKTTNKETTLDFLKQMSAALRDTDAKEKPFLLIDGHPAHRSKFCKEFLYEHFQPLLMPTGTPEVNSIGKYIHQVHKAEARRACVQGTG